MYNDYFISPALYSDSIYLTHIGDQPFASFGSKTLVPGVTSVCLPSAPPHDNQPRGLISEFLLIYEDGRIGKQRVWRRMEAGPTGKRQNLYRLDPRSQYAESWLDAPWLRWRTVTTSFEGKPVHMIWHDSEYGDNPLATSLVRQEDTQLPEFHDSFDIIVRSTAYLVLRQMWKPVVDIRTTKYPLATDFEREIRPIIKGWWHAIKIDSGWRLYADDKDELFEAKLKIRT